VSSLTDRTDGFRVVDAPTKLTMDPEWVRQFQLAKLFVDRLKRNCFAAFYRGTNGSLGNIGEALKVAKSPEEMTSKMDKAMEHLCIEYWVIPEEERMRMGIDAYESHKLHVSLKDVTRLFLTLQRKGSYSWHHDKCVKHVTEYQEIRHKLKPYSDMISMPALTIPDYDASKRLPFMEEILYATQKWKDRVYDHENKKVLISPHNCVQLTLKPTKRRLLVSEDLEVTPVNSDGQEVPELIGLYDVDYLVKSLDKIIENYDIETQWNMAQNAIGSLEHTFYPVSKD